MNNAIIIPALNEEWALPMVLADLNLVVRAHSGAPLPVKDCDIIVADNGSTDRTVDVAIEGGARVIHATPRGYGAACLAALRALRPETDVVVFMDGDRSDFAEDLPALLAPIAENRADLVLGRRVPVEGGALTLQQRFGNALACGLMRLFFGHRFEDLGPFRVIRRSALERLKMQDTGFGWTIEMQIKALRLGLRIVEIPVRYRARIGKSKISGTVMGSLRAGKAILGTILRFAWRPRSA